MPVFQEVKCLCILFTKHNIDVGFLRQTQLVDLCKQGIMKPLSVCDYRKFGKMLKLWTALSPDLLCLCNITDVSLLSAFS